MMEGQGHAWRQVGAAIVPLSFPSHKYKQKKKPAVKRQRARDRLPDPEWSTPIEVKSAAAWRFTWHEEILKRWDLEARSEIAVAGVLMHVFRDERGYAEIGFAKLAKRAGCSRPRAHKAIHRLQSAGFLVILNAGVKTKKKEMETHRYRLIYASRGVV